MQSEYEQKLNDEIEARIAKMEEPDYQFAKRFGRREYLATGIVIVICFIALILGAYI